MLEVMGIRTGVEDDDADSDEEDNRLNEYDVGWGQPYKTRWKRRGPRGEEYSVSASSYHKGLVTTMAIASLELEL